SGGTSGVPLGRVPGGPRRRPAGTKALSAAQGRRSARQTSHSTPKAGSIAAASRHAASSNVRFASGSVVITTSQPQREGRLFTVRAVVIASADRRERKSEAPT